MKLSIAWIFDHIDADWKKIDITHLVNLFNQKVAEIEGYIKIHIPLEPFTLVKIIEAQGDQCVGFSQEWQQKLVLPARKGVTVDQIYLAKKQENSCTWATDQDFSGEKGVLMPALFCDPSDLAGAWKQKFETHDYILTLDNKSITHRPDMWGHRGVAREIAALLDAPFKPLSQFLADTKIHEYGTEPVQATKGNPFSVRIDAGQACKRIAGMYLDNVKNHASSLHMAHRLVRVDARPIDALVDITNYVMLDLGQPMHAFSASSFGQKQLVVRMAKNKEQLTLLDGQTVELCDQDLVISDGQIPLALAGVMGGKESGVSDATTSILIEAACFDAVTIRKTATRYKKRSEASARFEKSLDPNQNTFAIARFLKLMHDEKISAQESDEIFSLGKRAPDEVIKLSHDTIEKRLGVTLASGFIINTLTKLAFGVELHNGVYTVIVPSFRSTKDIKIKEDIIEEIGRFYGYTAIETYLPALQLQPKLGLDFVYRQRVIKQTLAVACQMRELYTYAFFDEEFLQHIHWQPGATLEVQSPVSENWRRLVTTLVPNVLKVVMTNSVDHESLRFFELARVWHYATHVEEKKSLCGIFYDKKNVDFYDAKAELQKLLDVLKISVEWVKVEKPEHPWYAPYQTAYLVHNQTKIGIAGALHPTFLTAHMQGDAFIFELDADFLLNYAPAIVQVKVASKYPDMIRDISMLIASDMTVDYVTHIIAQVDTKIIQVSLIDFFEKEEWPDQRAMTLRFVISDNERTMTKEQADVIWDSVAAKLKTIGATIR